MPAQRVSMIEENVNGVPVLIPEFGYKTFSMVVKSIGYLTNRTSPTFFRTSGIMEKDFGQPQVSQEYPKPSVEYIKNLYNSCSDKALDTIIISPGLELACYLGRVLNAAILPSQFIASAPDLPFIERNASDENLYVVGHETDWPNLCVWVKPVNLIQLYGELLEQAKQVIIIKANAHLNTPRLYQWKNISINGVDGGESYWDLLKEPEKRGYHITKDEMPHWEFAMDDQQIKPIEEYCKAKGKRVATITTGDWSCFIPAGLFAEFYAKNNIQPKGITVHNYWSCHPFYESMFHNIPIYNFQYGANQFLNAFYKWLNSISFQAKEAEYLVWDDKEMAKTKAIFEELGLSTTYCSNRAYDIWQYGDNKFDDLHNPTREWIVPRLSTMNAFYEFKKLLTFSEVFNILKNTPKTQINQIN